MPRVAVQVQFKRRRGWRLTVSGPGKVNISAPEGTPPARIDELLNKNRKWIARRLKEFDALKNVPRLKNFSSGEKFLFLGETIELNIESSAKTKILFSEGRLLISTRLPAAASKRKETVRRRIKSWFKENAQEILSVRMKRWALQIGVKPKEMHIKEMRTRWGSCSTLGNINFNWRILMSPIQIIDYLVVHELCHMIHANHSQSFWTEVEKHIPDWKARRKWLRTHGAALEIP